MPKLILYHGSPFKFDKFNIERVESALEQEGPGIYLTTDFNDACRYGKYIYKVQWTYTKLISTSVKSENYLRQYARGVGILIRKSDNWQETVQNWDENVQKGLAAATQSCIEYAQSQREIYLNVWGDFYKKEPASFCHNVNMFGYDGFVLDRQNGVKHAIVYDPEKIKIIEVKESMNENINLDIEVGDEIRTGKFRNKKVIVKKIGTDEHGSPTVNGKSILAIRIPKIDPTVKNKKELEEGEKIKCKCGWEWNKNEGGKDLYVCHKCNNDNTPLVEKILKEAAIK